MSELDFDVPVVGAGLVAASGSPFLGVHFTRRVDDRGRSECLLALAIGRYVAVELEPVLSG